ncbi:ArgE/DapE family deacylase [Bacillus luteolus]|uniref:Probable succinyl-diaminopimelate desuccinylase n=1 Tax=Litchfieldia luteola TaxID=682179 RepID=A0ABR9QDG9_9BACI|nr:ArgE/DapE family deacylase [Cytobacillus luteolus]MBE4906521.1 ArgE/DapE family deacylase [Cytobacillus luteolus]MBP1941204.1 succinyl-diaminopimelate desuccinylase [Cytobacillus luteolus]
MKHQILNEIKNVEDEIVSLLSQMIQIPSVNPPGEYEAICDFLYEKLTSYGFDDVYVLPVPENLIKQKGLQTNRQNLIATLKGDGTGPSLILNAHLDTVPEDDHSMWTFPPFSGLIHDGKVFGRGATDSKGRLAAYIGAALVLKRAGIPLSGDLIIAATCDEETGGELGAGYLASNGLIEGDFALVEGYSQEIIHAMAGMTQLIIKSVGVPAHSGFKWNGINAIEKMAKVINGLEKLQSDLMNEPSNINGMKYTTINVGVISGGTKSNVVPGSCEIEVDLRIIPEHSIDSIVERIENMVFNLKVDDPDMNIIIQKKGEAETTPTIIERNHPIIEALQKASIAMNNVELPIVGVMGQSDSRWFIQNGIPAINYGPGTPTNRLHGYDEYMEISDLLNTVKVISLFCLNIVNQTVESEVKR